jgi:hypothetical protein
MESLVMAALCSNPELLSQMVNSAGSAASVSTTSAFTGVAGEIGEHLGHHALKEGGNTLWNWFSN